jgi:hypothetical protein
VFFIKHYLSKKKKKKTLATIVAPACHSFDVLPLKVGLQSIHFFFLFSFFWLGVGKDERIGKKGIKLEKEGGKK